MKLRVLPALLLICVFTTLGCGSCETVKGSGNIEETQFDVSGFTTLDTCCGWRVIINQGEDEGIEVRGDSNIIEDIVVDQNGTALSLDYRDSTVTYLPTQQVRVEVTVADLDSYTASGGSDVTMNEFSTTEVDVLMTGGSDFEAKNLTADALDLECSGGGDIRISGGNLTRQDILISGGGSYRSTAVESAEGDFLLSGGSEATAWITDTLGVEASGGSKMRYYGDPDVTRTVSGGSTVERLGATP